MLYILELSFILNNAHNWEITNLITSGHIKWLFGWKIWVCWVIASHG